MYIYLDIVNDFQCKMCGKCCRNDWLVTLDAASYQRNREFFVTCGREAEFSAAFSRRDDLGAPGEYAVINKKAGACWFLRPDNRCELHAQAGHEHLDSVCQTFPRYPMDTSRGTELTLSFSCPAVMALVERVRPLDVLRSELPPLSVREDIPAVQVYPEQQLAGQPLRYYFELEHHFIDILQCRGLAITKRLQLLEKTATALEYLNAGDAPGMKAALTKVIYANYEFLDVHAVPDSPDAVFTADILLEHFFVNLTFRKIFYLYGLVPAARLLSDFGQRLRVAGEGAPESKSLAAIRGMVADLEFAFGHNRNALGTECRKFISRNFGKA